MSSSVTDSGASAQHVPSSDDVGAAQAVAHHHDQMAGSLADLGHALLAAARSQDPEGVDRARSDLVAWCLHQLVPHALAEESTMYAAAGELTSGRLLVEAMLAEHRVIVGLVSQLEAAKDPFEAVAVTRALQVLFETHLGKENEQVLPLLVATPEVSVADLLGGMHELLGAD